MRYLLLLPVVLVVTTIALKAQQLSLFTQYRENASVINPAALETDFLAFGQNLSIGASYRAQWVGLDNAPTTQTLRFSYLNTEFSGVTFMAGAHLINDKTGPTGFTGFYGKIAGVVTQDPEYSGLVVGMSVGAVQYRVKSSEIFLREDGDVVGTENQSQLYPDVGVGVYYYQTVGDANYFYTGVSVPQVVGLDLTFKNDLGEFYTKRVQHFYGLLGFYNFFDNDSFLEPSMWVKYAPNVPVNVDLNLRYQMPGGLWMGTGVSSAKIFHLDAGILLGANSLDNTIRIGYGFDYSFSSFGPSAGSTHELNVSFAFDR
ncbi:MAG: PorP/SprF family type IX secretion system membrane protein [Saprospiraceae bacterium]|nr:PorP/SprF family type IX secretion system membrane protein [Saprospiraceae bacterium]